MDTNALNERIAKARETAISLAQAEQRVAAFSAELAEQPALKAVPVRSIESIPKSPGEGSERIGYRATARRSLPHGREVHGAGRGPRQSAGPNITPSGQFWLRRRFGARHVITVRGKAADILVGFTPQ
jgi:hypothetical protein